jgi:hypothetical protein
MLSSYIGLPRAIRGDSAHESAHLDALAKLLPSVGRSDADGVDTLYLARDLEQVSAETLDIFRFPLLGRTIMDFTNELMVGAGQWSYDVYNTAGKADWIVNWSTPVGGQAAGKRRVTVSSHMFASHYQYTIQDLERAAFAKSKNASNRALDAEVAKSCRLSHEQFMDRIVWNGDATRNIVGLPQALVAMGATIGDFADISTVEGSENQVTYLRPTHKLYTSGVFSGDGPKVVQALNELVLAVFRNTGGGVKATNLLLPLSFKSIMIQPYSNSILDGKTIETVFLQNNPGVKIDYVYALDDKSATANSPGGRAIAFFKAPSTFRFVLAYDYREMPVQIHEMCYHIPTYGEIVGPVYQRPLQMAQMDLDNETNA